MKNILLVTLIVISILGLIAAGFAEVNKEGKQETNPKEENVTLSVTKEIEGEVSAVNKRGIAVVYNKDVEKGVESEIFIPFENGKIKMVHKRNIEEIQVGDTVKVEYVVLTEETKEGKSSRFDAKTVTFLRAAQKKPIPSESAETIDEPEEGALPFKGIK